MWEICTEAVHAVALWTGCMTTLDMWSMYRSSPLRSPLNTGFITALDMCEVCTEQVHSIALWTRVTSQLWTCGSMYGSSPLSSTLNTGSITALDMCEVCPERVHSVALWTWVTSQLWTCLTYVWKQSNGLSHSNGHVWSMYRSNPFRSTLNTGYITALDMCEVCTEAVHSVASWTRVTSQLWTCVKFVRKQSMP